MMEESERLITCPSCQTVNEDYRALCQKCGAPFSTFGTLDPIHHIHAEAQVLRGAIEGRPRVVVLLGIWLLIFPIWVLGAGSAVALVVYRRQSSDVVFFWLAFAVACFTGVILYRVTKNYLTKRAPLDDADDEGEE